MGSTTSVMERVRPLTEKEEKFQQLFTTHKDSIKIDDCILPRISLSLCEDIKDFQFQKGDVLVMSFPKSGTTWTQEIVWTMVNNRNLDNPEANQSLLIKSPQIETDIFMRFNANKGQERPLVQMMSPNSEFKFMDILNMMDSPRILKTHAIPDFISPTAFTKAKVVYVVRDPRDVCLSYYHHCRLFTYESYTGTLDQFITGFLDGSNWMGPYWKHIESAWKMRTHPNIHFCSYEKLKENTLEEYEKLAQFLGLEISREEMQKIIKYTSFAEMKKRDNFFIPKSEYEVYMNEKVAQSEGGFFRKGEKGQWRTVFNDEQKTKFSQWFRDNCPSQDLLEEFNIRI